MTMTNAEWMIKEGHKFIELDAKYIVQDHGCRITLNGETLEIVPLVDITNAIIYWLDMEHKEPILDDAERRYLSAVIRPFRDKVTAIAKINDLESDYIVICLEFENVCLPDFPTGTMYKGMKKGHDYTLEELGL